MVFTSNNSMSLVVLVLVLWILSSVVFFAKHTIGGGDVEFSWVLFIVDIRIADMLVSKIYNSI